MVKVNSWKKGNKDLPLISWILSFVASCIFNGILWKYTEGRSRFTWDALFSVHTEGYITPDWIAKKELYKNDIIEEAYFFSQKQLNKINIQNNNIQTLKVATREEELKPMPANYPHGHIPHICHGRHGQRSCRFFLAV